MIATIGSAPPERREECKSGTLEERQRADTQLNAIISYLETGKLPAGEKEARELVLWQSQFTMKDGVLYRVQPDKTLRIVPPTVDRHKLFNEVHGGLFAGHLREEKTHSTLSRHYWWPKIRADISRWCQECLRCATRSTGRPVRPPLTPIPVNGPFDRVGVDVLQLPKTRNGNRYAVVFIDYLTKWPEVFATADQTAPTIAGLFVEHVISRHGVPNQLLSDRGPSFLSRLMLEVCSVLGTKKVTTSAYHPQTDGLVERFNRTLTDMLAKTVELGVEWDERLPYVLFAYRASEQASTGESPFMLLYGRDPQLLTELVLFPPVQRSSVDLNTYKSTMIQSMSEAWSVAKETLKKAQRIHHDNSAKNADFQIGERVFLFVPSLRSGPSYKLARPFKGPYRILQLYPNGAELQLIDRPHSPTIRVALNRLRHFPGQTRNSGVNSSGLAPSESTPSSKESTSTCPNEEDDVADRNETTARENDDTSVGVDEVLQPAQPPIGDEHDSTGASPWKDRLRPRLASTRGRAAS